MVTTTPCGAQSPEVKSDSHAQPTEPPRRPLETALSEDSPICFPEHLLRRWLGSSALQAPVPARSRSPSSTAASSPSETRPAPSSRRTVGARAKDPTAAQAGAGITVRGDYARTLTDVPCKRRPHQEPLAL